jgi:anti-sigma factor RsiW
MVCKDIKDEIFEAALLGEAPAESVKAHLAGCTACESEYKSLLSTMNVLDEWIAPEPSPYFDVRLRARLREVKEQEQHGRAASWLEKLGIRQLSWKPVAATAFALIMAVGGGLYVAGPNGRISGNATVQAACPVVDLQALDKNQQVLNELQDLESSDDNSGANPAQVNE